jgi:hypothetical protein
MSFLSFKVVGMVLITVYKKKILSPSPAAIVEIEPIFFANFPCPPLYLEAQRYLIAL